MKPRGEHANPHKRFEITIVPVQPCTREERRMMKYFAIYWGEIMQHEPHHGIMSAKELRNTIVAMLDVYYPISYWTITETFEQDKIIFNIFRKHGKVLLITLKAAIVYRPADN